MNILMLTLLLLVLLEMHPLKTAIWSDLCKINENTIDLILGKGDRSLHTFLQYALYNTKYIPFEYFHVEHCR